MYPARNQLPELKPHRGIKVQLMSIFALYG